MIAEIHNKITKNNSNLSEMSEDELTGNFFGHLRYIPFNEGLKPILKGAVFPPGTAAVFDKIDAGFWNDNIEFWPYDSEGELDAYLEFDQIVIGIEVKYKSRLSSDDAVDYSLSDEKLRQEQSRNQLQRESRIIARRGSGKTKILLLVGDAAACADIYADINKRKLLSGSEVLFCYATWQSLLLELRKLKSDNLFSSLIISDLIDLLARKGFEQFKTMDIDFSQPVSPDKYYIFNCPIETEFNFENHILVKPAEEYCYEFK